VLIENSGSDTVLKNKPNLAVVEKPRGQPA
jgi:hypothetical protein